MALIHSNDGIGHLDDQILFGYENTAPVSVEIDLIDYVATDPLILTSLTIGGLSNGEFVVKKNGAPILTPRIAHQDRTKVIELGLIRLEIGESIVVSVKNIGYTTAEFEATILGKRDV